MKDLKYELFNFNKSLTFEESEISNIVEGHIKGIDDHNQKQIINSLNENLKSYKFNSKVKNLLESLNLDLEQHELLYELKSLYNVLYQKNEGMLYRQALNDLLEVINLNEDADRMSKILNEIASLHSWIPEVKLFVENLTKNPESKTNLLSGGNCDPFFTIVETVEEGHLAYIKDSWFILKDDEIEKTLLENHINGDDTLRKLRTLETALKYSDIDESRINFRISENLTVGLGVENNEIYLNEDKVEEESTLESVFNSPLIPIINKNFFPLIQEVHKNIDSFVELDVVKHCHNMAKPHLECFVFNYKDNIYLYRCDERYGHSFFSYESALEAVNDVKNELNVDLTYFFENKLDKERVKKHRLEDKEREVTLKLEDIEFNIDKIESSIKALGESETLSKALENLNKRKDKLEDEILSIKELKQSDVYKLN